MKAQVQGWCRPHRGAGQGAGSQRPTALAHRGGSSLQLAGSAANEIPSELDFNPRSAQANERHGRLVKAFPALWGEERYCSLDEELTYCKVTAELEFNWHRLHGSKN